MSDAKLGTVSAAVRIEKGGLRTDIADIKGMMERMAKQMEDTAARAEARTTANLKKQMAQQIAARKAALEQYARDATATMAKVAAVGVAGLGMAVKVAADYEAMKLGLQAVEGSAEGAERALARLKEVAKLPGLGFREAVEGFTRLRAAGLDAQLAEKSLRGFANALATVGKGREELQGVNLALSQIAAKGKVSAEEINQLAERVPQIRQIMIKAFGTADTEILQRAKLTSKEFLEAITSELGKLPQATGGAKNAFENMKDTAEQALASLGETLLPMATKAVGALDGAVKKLTDAWKALPRWASEGIGKIAEIALIAVPVALGIGKITTALIALSTQLVALRALNGGSILAGLAGTLGTGGVVGIGAAAVAAGAYMGYDLYQHRQEEEAAKRRAAKTRVPDEVMGVLNRITAKEALLNQLKKEKASAEEIRRVEQQIAALFKEARAIDVRLRPERAKAYEDADKKKAADEQKRADYLKRIRDEQTKKAREAAEELRRQQEDAADKLYSLTHSEWDGKRRQALRDFEERGRKGLNSRLNQRIYQAELASIAAEEKKAAAELIKQRQETLRKITDDAHLALAKNNPNNFFREFDLEVIAAVQERSAKYREIGGEKNDPDGWIAKWYNATVEEIERRRQLAIAAAQAAVEDIQNALATASRATGGWSLGAAFNQLQAAQMAQKLSGLSQSLAGTGQHEAQIIERVKAEQEEQRLLDKRRELEYRYQMLSQADYLQYLRNRLQQTIQFSDDWAAIMQKIEEIEKQQAEAQAKREQERMRRIQSLRDGFQNVFANAFENALNGSKDFFSSLLDGFKQMIARMIAEALAAKVMSALFGGGTGFFDGLLGVFGFDDAHNDRIASRWGWDAARNFAVGAFDYDRQRGVNLAGAGAGSQSLNITVNMGGVTMTSNQDARQFADEIAWHVQQRLPVVRR
jgi:tape measure domain-containing protein